MVKKLSTPMLLGGIAVIILFGMYIEGSKPSIQGTVPMCGECMSAADCASGLCRFKTDGAECGSRSPYCYSTGLLVCADTAAEAMACSSGASCTSNSDCSDTQECFLNVCQECTEWTYGCRNDGVTIYEYKCSENRDFTTCASCSGITDTYSSRQSISTITSLLCSGSSACSDDSDCTDISKPYCYLATGECLSGCEFITKGGVYTNCVEHPSNICEGKDMIYCNVNGDASVFTAYLGAQQYSFCLLGPEPGSASSTTCSGDCVNGQCTICTPNSQYCDLKVVKQCNSDGTATNPVDTCSDQEYCEQVSATSAICKPINQLYCFGQTSCDLSSTDTGHCYSTSANCTLNFNHYTSTCYINDLYWVSYSGVRNDPKEDCATTCVNNACYSPTIPPPAEEEECTPFFTKLNPATGECDIQSASVILIIFGLFALKMMSKS